MTNNIKHNVARLRLRVKFDKHPDYLVEAEKAVYIEHDAVVAFVETDKPIYKPGQVVNIRLLALKHDLKPWAKPVSYSLAGITIAKALINTYEINRGFKIPKVWIENPSEVRVAQWTNVSTENGMAQLSFPLSPEPSFVRSPKSLSIYATPSIIPDCIYLNLCRSCFT